MMTKSFKKGDGFGVGYQYTEADFDNLYGKIVDLSDIPLSEKFPITHNKPHFLPNNPKGGVWTDKPKSPTKKQV